MKIIEKLEQAKKENLNLKEIGINRTFYWAYIASKRANNRTINFNDVIWNDDVVEIIKHCIEFKISEITISSTYSGLIETLHLLEENGSKIKGLTIVKSESTDIVTGEHNMLKAIELSIPLN